jgi:hypothetical protein
MRSGVVFASYANKYLAASVSAARHGARLYLAYGRSFPNKLPGLGQIEELMKKCLVQVGALKEGFVAPVVVAQVTDSTFGANGFNTGLFPFFDYRQPLSSVKPGPRFDMN